MKILNLITLLLVVFTNAMANLLPINGQNTGQVSAQYDNYFTPAGFTFSIWSIIYIGLLIFAIYQFFSKKYQPQAIGLYFCINGLANIGWILAWHYGYFLLTLLMMAILLVTLIQINWRLNGTEWLIKWPFRIYLGWICVATIANIAVYFTYSGWNGMGIKEPVWGIVLVAVAGILSWILILSKKWITSALTIAWGLWGIYNKQLLPGGDALLQNTCLIMVTSVIILSALIMLLPKKAKRTPALRLL